MMYANKEQTLVRASRPGHPKNDTITESDVDDWISEAKKMNVKTIICLLHEDEHLRYYRHLPEGGLIERYIAEGFDVVHIPVIDHKAPAMSREELDKALSAYDAAEKPVIVHCSAGHSRTGETIDHILANTSAKQDLSGA